MKSITRLLLSPLKNILGVGYGTCGCCGFHWNMVEPHTIYITNEAGCFATCCDCWERKTDSEIMKAYENLYDSWLSGDKFNPPLAKEQIGFTKEQMMTTVKQQLKKRALAQSK